MNPHHKFMSEQRCCWGVTLHTSRRCFYRHYITSIIYINTHIHTQTDLHETPYSVVCFLFYSQTRDFSAFPAEQHTMKQLIRSSADHLCAAAAHASCFPSAPHPETSWITTEMEPSWPSQLFLQWQTLQTKDRLLQVRSKESDCWGCAT